jgi:hypothetical protein
MTTSSESTDVFSPLPASPSAQNSSTIPIGPPIGSPTGSPISPLIGVIVGSILAVVAAVAVGIIIFCLIRRRKLRSRPGAVESAPGPKSS